MICSGSSDDSCRSMITIKVLPNPNPMDIDDDIVVCETWSIKTVESKDTKDPTNARSPSLARSPSNTITSPTAASTAPTATSTKISSLFNDTVQPSVGRGYGTQPTVSRDNEGNLITPVLAKTQHYTSTSAILNGQYLYVAGNMLSFSLSTILIRFPCSSINQ
jgi:hypothetical protein